MSSGSGSSSTGVPPRRTRQAPTICSISEMSSKYVRYDRIFLPEVGHGDAGQLDMLSCRLQDRVLTEDERSRDRLR